MICARHHIRHPGTCPICLVEQSERRWGVTGMASVDRDAMAACQEATDRRKQWYHLAREAWLKGQDAPRLGG